MPLVSKIDVFVITEKIEVGVFKGRNGSYYVGMPANEGVTLDKGIHGVFWAYIRMNFPEVIKIAIEKYGAVEEQYNTNCPRFDGKGARTRAERFGRFLKPYIDNFIEDYKKNRYVLLKEIFGNRRLDIHKKTKQLEIISHLGGER